MTLFKALALVLLTFDLGTADHVVPQNGHRYWLLDGQVAYRVGASLSHFNFNSQIDAKLFKVGPIDTFVVTDKDKHQYTLKFNSGVERSIQIETIDELFENHVIVDYDPVQHTKRQAAAASQKRSDLIKSKKWSPAIEKLVLEGKIRIGMTAEQAQIAWGKPRVINRSVASHGINEQWVYPSAYLYFDNGVLSSWQDSR